MNTNNVAYLSVKWAFPPMKWISRGCLFLALTAAYSVDTSEADSLKDWNHDTPIEKLGQWMTRTNALDTWLDEAGKMVTINMDPVLRQIVCRVAYQPFTNANLAKAMSVSDTRIANAASKLQAMELIRVEGRGGHNLFFPASKKAEAIMKRWSVDWCLNEEECGVAQ